MIGFHSMPTTIEPPPSPRAPSWRAVGLPVEHGGWSFLIEPIILGLWVEPSVPGSLIAVSAVGAFLARHPLRLLWLDARKQARYPRTALAERFLAVYALVSTGAFLAALLQGSPALLRPLVAAAPIALVALGLDLAGRSREALTEAAGAVALCGSAAVIILSGAGDATIAWLAWGLCAARAITAILYVRARVRANRDLDPDARGSRASSVIAVHAGAVLVAVIGLSQGRLSAWVVFAFLLLFLRALNGLAKGAPIRPQRLGVQEVLVGAICVAFFALALK